MADRAELLNDAETAMRLVLDGRQAVTWNALPGIVEAVDFETMTCTVQPAIQGKVFDELGGEQIVNLPLLLDVPVVFPSAGGFTITLPLKAGDEVLVVIASRCIDAWWALGGVQVPMEARMHDLSDGFAIPGPRSQPRVLENISASAAQIRNDEGTAYIEIQASGQIRLVSPTGVSVQGNLAVTGTVMATGQITSGLIPLTTHTHLSSTPGNPTGPALP